MADYSILYDLYDNWFSNKDYWFSKNEEYDIFVSDKYFQHINIVDKIDINNSDKNLLIACIILLDQISRHYKRAYRENINTILLSKKAIKFSDYLLNSQYKFSINELCFIYLPYRHINDINKIKLCVEVFIELYNNSEGIDKITCKKYIYNTLNNIYKNINVNSYTNKIPVKKLNDINKNILDEKCLVTYLQEYNNESSNIYQTIYKQLLNLKDNSTFIVSLSGGVDSVVLLHILNNIRKTNSKIKNLIAIHINYNNRQECSNELDFVNYYCNSLNVKLIYRNIDEINRNNCKDNGLRDLYEDITKKIRCDMYKYGFLFSNNVYVLLGHNKDDCFENIITNISNKYSYENLSGMEYISLIDGISYWRPMLNIYKKNIISYANNNNLKYLKDSTPKWSVRGKIRDELKPVLCNLKNNNNESIIEAFFSLKEYLCTSNQIINNIIVENLIKKLINSDSYIYTAIYNLEELKIFQYLNISILFFKNIKINATHKSIIEFTNYITSYINTLKVKKFVLSKHCVIIIKKYFENYQIIFNLSK